MTAIDWKSTGYLAGAVLAGLAAIKKVVSPFAVSQVRDAMQPEFDKLNARCGGIERSIAALEQAQTKLAIENAYLRGKADIPS